MVSTNFSTFSPVSNFGTKNFTSSLNLQTTSQYSNGLQRTPDKDTVTISNKKEDKQLSKNKKILIGAGAAAAAVVGLLCGHQAIKSHQISKALRDIDVRFANIEQDMPKVVDTFKNVFMRDNMTQKEAKEILLRYKNIEKLGVTASKEEYVKALANETKSNFGFDDGLSVDVAAVKDKYIGGANASLANAVFFNTAESKQFLRSAVFHELRHTKQDYLAINNDVNRFLEVHHVFSPKEKANIIPWLQKKCGVTSFSKDNIPKIPGINDYIEKLYGSWDTAFNKYRYGLHSKQEYEDYFNNFIEMDARNSADSMTDLLYGFKLKLRK